MAFKIRPATSDDDPGVSKLFYDAQVAVVPEYWERAFSPENPPESASQPLVAIDHEDEVLGFLAARPAQLHVESEFIPVRVLHDFLAAPGEVQRDVAGILLKDAIRLGDVALVAGSGPELSKLLNQVGLQRVGFFARLRFNPKSKAPDRTAATTPVMPLTEAAHFPPETDEVTQWLGAERKVFIRRNAERLNWLFRGPASDTKIMLCQERTPCDAYAVLRRADGRFGDELHVVDCACPTVDVRRFAAALAQLARHEGAAIYLSVLGSGWESQFVATGWEALRPRWPLYWILRDPRQRATGGALLREEAWFFTAADGEIDQW